MKVLVTGATGFIGRRATSDLAARPGVEVVAAARTPDPALGVETVAVDLLEAGAARSVMEAVRPTHLLHFAWNAKPGRFWTSHDNLSWCAASIELLRAFSDCSGQRAVLAGSCAEYDWTSDAVLSETGTRLEPETLYGVAKDALRRIALRAAPELGLSIAWGRIFWLYGPGEPLGRLVSDTAHALASGRRASTSPGLQERDFMHVDDVGSAFVTALFSGFEGTFNVGSGVAVRVIDVVTTIAGVLGRRDLLDIGALGGAREECPRLCADVRVLTEQIGFSPRFSLADGLRQTAEWWGERSRMRT